MELSVRCLDLSVWCLELSFVCLELSFGCLELSFGCLELSFGCLDLSFGCLDLSFGCLDVFLEHQMGYFPPVFSQCFQGLMVLGETALAAACITADGRWQGGCASSRLDSYRKGIKKAAVHQALIISWRLVWPTIAKRNLLHNGKGWTGDKI